MAELIALFQSYFVNQAFLATLLLITLNNIWKRIEIETPLLIVKYVLIIAGLIATTQFFYYLFFDLESEDNSLTFINRATGSYKGFYIFMLFSSTLLPILLFIKKFGSNKYFILLISFLINIGFWFERFVIIVTSLHRGHLPSTWSMFYPTWVELFIFIILFISITLLIIYVRKKIKK